MAQLITREELALVLDEVISVERFNALYTIGLRVIATGYKGNPEDATGDAANVIAGVLFGVIARIVSNPKGARQLAAGAASVTFGGSDVEISKIFSLTDSEREDLAAVSPVAATRSGAFTIFPYRS